MERDGRLWNVMEPHRRMWNIGECGRLLWKAVEQGMEHDRKLWKGHGRLWNLLEQNHGKKWKEVEGDGTVEYSRTFHAKF